MRKSPTLFALLIVLAGAAGLDAQPKVERDLAHGIERVKEGDFETAIKILEAVTWELEGNPSKFKDLAQGYLYLGIAYLETDDEARARQNFKLAQRFDKRLKLRATEFSAQTIRVFEAARQDEAAIEERTATAAPTPAPSPTPLVIRDPGEWLAETGDGLQMQMAHRHGAAVDFGVLAANPAARELTWRGTGSPACPTALQIPFADVRSVSAAPQGGFVLEPTAARAEKWILIPRPHGAWLEKVAVPQAGTAAVKRADVPREVQFDVNLAVGRLLDAMGRSTTAAGALPDALYGVPVDATLADLLETPSDYEGRAVRLRGRLDVVSRDRGEYLIYADTAQLQASPSGEIQALVRSRARDWAGKEMEVTGVFRRRPPPPRADAKTPAFSIRFWDYLAPGAERPSPPKVEGTPMMLEDLVTEPDRFAGKVVRVVGRFRGRNLHGDLPLDSRRRDLDWVIKDDLFAAWVTGRAPQGEGFTLDATSIRDTVAWVAVTGKVEVHDGYSYVRANHVEMSPPPSANARVRMALPKGPVANLPPTVVMTVPLEFEEIAADARLTVQFSQEMNEDSFKDRVELRYADSQATALPRTRALYDDRRRALVVEPGTLLQPGRTVEFRLLKGIIDAQGRPLVPREGSTPPDGAAETIRFKIGS
jgi:hypothetical protein